MKIEKSCRKCDKQYPSNIMFCPECGSMTMLPEAPVVTPAVKAVRPKRASALTSNVSPPPARAPPPKVRVEHSRENYFGALAKNNVPEEDVDVIRKLIGWSEGIADSTTFGDNSTEGGRAGFRPMIRAQDKDVSLFWISTDGRIEVYFDNWIHIPPFDSREKRVELLRKLNAIKGVSIPENKIVAKPPVPVRMLREQADLDTFIGIFEWFVGLVRGH
jgi:hypothetical protein